MSDYLLTVGLEVHVQLKTKTKMFSSSRNNPDEERPNVNISPIDLAHPGTLPTINKKAVEHVLRVGVAVGGELADFTEFDRKNYFYPDIPKGYQISQYKYPLVSGGSLSGVALTRIHLEEDTARSQHVEGDDEHSAVDYNRAGIPLMELVTEPVITSAEQAGDFARELQLLLRYLGVSDANMEKGEMRVEANISVASKGKKGLDGLDKSVDRTDMPVLGTKVEVKNLNSFKVVEKAIEYEYKRQTNLLEKGEIIVQETRGWDEGKQETFSQRTKETAEDYRYFPEPDLPKLKISDIPEFHLRTLEESMPELPWKRRERYLQYGLKNDDAHTLVRNIGWAEFFDDVLTVVEEKDITIAANYFLSDLAGIAGETKGFGKLNAETFGKLISLVSKGTLSSRGAKDTLAILYREGGDPLSVAESHGLIQKNDAESLRQLAREVIEENQKIVEEFRSGKDKVVGFLVGQGMQKSGGSANPQTLKEILLEELRK